MTPCSAAARPWSRTRTGSSAPTSTRCPGCSSSGPSTLLPGHGPVRDDAGALAREYLAHRAQRLDQVRAALKAGASTPEDVVRRVYADVDPSLWPAAELSVRAQLDYLAEPHP